MTELQTALEEPLIFNLENTTAPKMRPKRALFQLLCCRSD